MRRSKRRRLAREKRRAKYIAQGREATRMMVDGLLDRRPLDATAWAAVVTLEKMERRQPHRRWWFRQRARRQIRRAEFWASNRALMWRLMVDVSIGLPRPKPTPGSLTWSMTATLTHVSGPDLFDVLLPQHGHGSNGGAA
jgi:Rad3-related DNA helicase